MSKSNIIVGLIIIFLLTTFIADGNVLVQFGLDTVLGKEVVLFQVKLHPSVVLHLLNANPLLRVLDHYLGKELLGLCGHVVPGIIIEVILAVLYLLEQLEVVLIIKGRRATQKYVSHDTYTPVVALAAVRHLH